MEFLQRIMSAFMSFIIAIFSFFGLSLPKNEKYAVHNVILMIGDGMGFNTLSMTESDYNTKLTVRSLPQQGSAKTYSASSSVTDSAAGATALACGIKTANKTIGCYWFDEPNCTYTPGTHPKNITELCMEHGMQTGIVTTDYTSGATPAGFSVHTQNRKNTEDIYAQQLCSGIDLIWGKSEDCLTPEEINAAGYTYVSTIDEMNAVTANEKSFAQFTASTYHPYNKNEYTPTLSQMTESAIHILSGSQNGFFLMVEGAHIDKNADDNNRSKTTEAVLEFDNAVKKALDFAKKDKNTLVIVTADHETGGIVIGKDGSFSFTTTGHTGADVPVAAYGSYQIIRSGEVIENIDIPKRIALALSFEDREFPVAVPDAEVAEQKAAA